MRYLAIEKNKHENEQEARANYIVAYSFERGQKQALEEIRHTCKNAAQLYGRGGQLFYAQGIELYIDNGKTLSLVETFLRK